jgi:hypothetical protein
MRHFSEQRARSNLRVWTQCVLLASALMCISPARGEDAATNHGSDVAFQVAVRSDYKKTDEHAERQRALVLATHLRRASTTRPYSAGLVLEYSFVDDGRDTLLLGGMFTHRRGKWAAAASPFYKGTPRTRTGQWYGWGSLRRQVTKRHSLGVEVLRPIGTDKPAKWLLGYSGTISESVSLNLAVGSELGDGADRVVRGSVVWRPRELGRSPTRSEERVDERSDDRPLREHE